MLKLFHGHLKTEYCHAMLSCWHQTQSHLSNPWKFISLKCVSTVIILNQSQKNFYEVLEVKRSASPNDIREAFLKLSKELHPDVNANDPENHQKFVTLNEAYTVLSKPMTRQDYDLTFQGEKHFRQQKTHPAYRSYGYQAESPHYHYGSHNVHWGGMSPPSSDDHYHSGKRLYRILVNFYSLTAFFTVGAVTFLLMGKDFIVPDVTRKKGMKKQKDMDVHDFIMTSQQEGKTVLYYAVPDIDNPEIFKVLAVAKNEDEESKEWEIQELNSVSSSSR